MHKIIVDSSKCTGCRFCQYVCSQRFVQDKGINPKISAVKIVTLGLFEVDVPIICRQCKRPLCKEKCPTEAFYYCQETGTWNIDEEKCMGCGVCAEECPFGVIIVHPERFAPIKCDLCGGDPQCTKNCPTGALSFIDEKIIGEEKRLDNARRIVRLKG